MLLRAYYCAIASCILQNFYILQNSSSPHCLQIPGTNLKEMEELTELWSKSCIPWEFPRKMRSIMNWGRYKAAEFKFFISYAAGPLLQDRVPVDVMKMILSLQYGIRLLSGSNPMDPGPKARALAHKHFKYYVQMHQHLFGKFSVR
jgi:hypothetical protein